MPEIKVTCEVCRRTFEAKRRTARFCGGKCRQQANRVKAKEVQQEASLGGFYSKLRISHENLDKAIREVVEEHSDVRNRALRRELLIGTLLSKLSRYLVDADSLEERVTKAEEHARIAWERADEAHQDWQKLWNRMGNPSDDMAPGQWEALLAMEPQQLQAWLKIGLRLARQDRPGAATDALHWVEQNMGVAADSNTKGNETSSSPAAGTT